MGRGLPARVFFKVKALRRFVVLLAAHMARLGMVRLSFVNMGTLLLRCGRSLRLVWPAADWRRLSQSKSGK